MMEVIPAIDLKQGRAVRLLQGRMEDETVFSPDPVAMALKWQAAGASRLHLVDLDAAVSGKSANARAIGAICRAISIPAQMGGGLRAEADVEAAFNLGLQRVVLGTLAVKEPQRALELIQRYPQRVLVSLDSRGGVVASAGWTEESSWNYLDLARILDVPELAGLVFTDINRDGMHSGPNLEASKALCLAVKAPVIASGGVHDINDIKNLLTLVPYGLAGVITGRAIYEGSLDLSQAIRLAA